MWLQNLATSSHFSSIVSHIFSDFLRFSPMFPIFIELDDGKIYRKTLYLMVKTMVSCRCSLKPIQWYLFPDFHASFATFCPRLRPAQTVAPWHHPCALRWNHGWSARQVGTEGSATVQLERWWQWPIYTIWLCQNSYWTWPFIVDFPTENGDFPWLC